MTFSRLDGRKTLTQYPAASTRDINALCRPFAMQFGVIACYFLNSVRGIGFFAVPKRRIWCEFWTQVVPSRRALQWSRWLRQTAIR